MKMIRHAAGSPGRLAVFPGAFNPVTIAHLALAHAALTVADEALFVLPAQLPHKDYRGATLQQRVTMLDAAIAGEPRFSLGVTDAGLFAAIACECAEVYGRGVRLSFLCGHDAARRVVEWDYGRPGAIEEMLKCFDLLVVSRGGPYVPPAALSRYVTQQELDVNCEGISATEVRERAARGEDWEFLVPPASRALARRIYASPDAA